MQKWAGIVLLFIAVSFLITVLFCPAYAETTERGEEALKEMVQDAQSSFERAVRLYQEGNTQKARELFEKCHRILLEADKIARNDSKTRIDRVFNIFYTKMAEIDPETAAKLKSIRKQVKRTYQDKPVYAGQVRYHVDYLLSNKRSFLEKSFDRAYRYLPMIKQVFSEAGIPEDLAYMALIESGFRPHPISHAGAKGLWQFIPPTARQYGLQVEGGVDERTDPLKSTRAAARYLADLYEEFGNWPLAVAAYNCGQGRVARALENNGASSYWELVEQDALPMETQRYVPSIIAVTLIAREPSEYGFNVQE